MYGFRYNMSFFYFFQLIILLSVSTWLLILLLHFLKGLRILKGKPSSKSVVASFLLCHRDLDSIKLCISCYFHTVFLFQCKLLSSERHFSDTSDLSHCLLIAGIILGFRRYMFLDHGCILGHSLLSHISFAIVARSGGVTSNVSFRLHPIRVPIWLLDPWLWPVWLAETSLVPVVPWCAFTKAFSLGLVIPWHPCEN